MIPVPMESLLEKTNSTYKLVLLAARRAIELDEGKPRLADVPATTQPALTALYEISQGKVGIKIQKKSSKNKK